MSGCNILVEWVLGGGDIEAMEIETIGKMCFEGRDEGREPYPWVY